MLSRHHLRLHLGRYDFMCIVASLHSGNLNAQCSFTCHKQNIRLYDYQQLPSAQTYTIPSRLPQHSNPPSQLICTQHLRHTSHTHFNHRRSLQRAARTVGPVAHPISPPSNPSLTCIAVLSAVRLSQLSNLKDKSVECSGFRRLIVVRKA